MKRLTAVEESKDVCQECHKWEFSFDEMVSKSSMGQKLSADTFFYFNFFYYFLMSYVYYIYILIKETSANLTYKIALYSLFH